VEVEKRAFYTREQIMSRGLSTHGGFLIQGTYFYSQGLVEFLKKIIIPLDVTNDVMHIGQR
jgi:hypothetical protein